MNRRSVLTPVAAALALICALPIVGCEDAPTLQERCDEPPMSLEVVEGPLSSIDCAESQDTGYTSGNPFVITVVTVDGKKVEKDTANAYYVMAQAAAADGVSLKISSGFRTMAEQQYFYSCYVNCNCNSCNLAAKPGFSNHQSGHALDLNTSSAGVYGWLDAHGATYGFKRTVPSEKWHWEWWGGGPGGGPCSAQCAPHCEGTQLIGADCGVGDCAVFGAYCSTAGAPEARCVSVFCVDSPAQAPSAHDVCLPDGKRAHCDGNGAVSEKPCPPGDLCVPDADATCQPPCTPTVEVCNGEDDDCDGQVDQGLGVGSPCVVGDGACAMTGAVACDGAGGTRCEAPGPDCDDGEPCTDDGCDPVAGCVHATVPLCCSAATACGPGEHCDGGLCVVALCAPCDGDDGCHGGGRCLKLRSGSYCGIPCDVGSCPLGTACMDLGGDGSMQCVPDSLDCACGPGVGFGCLDGGVARVDGCGRALGRVAACERGCAAASCCPAGTRAVDDACEPVEARDGEDGSEWEGSDASEGGRWGERVSEGDASGDGGGVASGGSFGSAGAVESVSGAGTAAGGCGAGGATGGAMWVLLAAAVGRRRREPHPGASEEGGR